MYTHIRISSYFDEGSNYNQKQRELQRFILKSIHRYVYILDLKVVNTKVGEILECPVNQRRKNTSAVVKPSKQRKNMKRI